MLAHGTAGEPGGRDPEPGGPRDVREIIGANLRRLREASRIPQGRPLSTEQLARLTALSNPSVWRFEHGKSGMTVATLVRFKEAFKCAWDDLLGGCENGVAVPRKYVRRGRVES